MTGPRRTAEQTDALIISLLTAEPSTVSGVSRALSLDYQVVKARLDALVSAGTVRRAGIAACGGRAPRFALPGHEPKTYRGRSARHCLCCGDPFRSDGPHNRMCTPCRNLAAQASPYAL